MKHSLLAFALAASLSSGLAQAQSSQKLLAIAEHCAPRIDLTLQPGDWIERQNGVKVLNLSQETQNRIERDLRRCKNDYLANHPDQKR